MICLIQAHSKAEKMRPYYLRLVITALMLVLLLATGCDHYPITFENRTERPLAFEINGHVRDGIWDDTKPFGTVSPGKSESPLNVISHEERLYIRAIGPNGKVVCSWDITGERLIDELNQKLVIDTDCPQDPPPIGLPDN